MANMCDNQLNFSCKEIPNWLKTDEDDNVILIDWEDRALFLYEPLSILLNEIKTNHIEWELFEIKLWFETKWAPPEYLIEKMQEDDNIISIDAVFYESWCWVLWSADKDFISFDDCPNRFSSEYLWLDILEHNPPESFLNMEGTDGWILFWTYLKQMYSNMWNTTYDIEWEIEECADMLNINMEDQQWVELISTFDEEAYTIMYVWSNACQVVFASNIMHALSQAEDWKDIKSITLN